MLRYGHPVPDVSGPVSGFRLHAQLSVGVLDGVSGRGKPSRPLELFITQIFDLANMFDKPTVS